MLQLLGHPLSFLNLHPEQKIGPSKRTERVCPPKDNSSPKIEPATFSSAKKLVKMIADVSPNVLGKVVAMDQVTAAGAESLEDEDKLNATSIGTFLYFVLGEGVCPDMIPAVYSKLHLLHSSSSYISMLLQSTYEMCVHKGLVLLQGLLDSIPTGSVGHEFSEDPRHLSLVTPLVHVCVYHDLLEMRTLGFLYFISMFSVKAR